MHVYFFGEWEYEQNDVSEGMKAIQGSNSTVLFIHHHQDTGTACETGECAGMKSCECKTVALQPHGKIKTTMYTENKKQGQGHPV